MLNRVVGATDLTWLHSFAGSSRCVLQIDINVE